jgi:hypothetical protein
MKVLTEITYGALAVGHVVLDPGGNQWRVAEKRQGYVGPTLTFAARVEQGNPALGQVFSMWIKGTFSEPIVVVDQTAGDSVETVGKILGGHIVMEPIRGGAKTARALLAGHLQIHHGMSVTGAKSDGSLKDLQELHASLHTPVSQPGSIPHVHKELP